MVLKIDEQFPSHTKVLGLSHRAFRLHVTGLCHCAANLTDGLVTTEAMRIIGAVSGCKGKSLTDELEQARLWVRIPAGWMIHGYLDWNQSKGDREEKRRVAKENADTRWNKNRTPNGNANGIPTGSAEGNASPAFALPLPLEALASSPPSSNHDREEPGEHDAHASKIGQIAFACRAHGEDYRKIERAARGCAEGDLVAALEACSGPGVHNRLAVALSEMSKRKAAKEARTA